MSTDNDPNQSTIQKGAKSKSPVRSECSSRRGSVAKTPAAGGESITVKDLFDFMKTAYQVYEHLEKDEDDETKINWEELTKLTIINHVIDQQDRELLQQTEYADKRALVSKSDTAIDKESKSNVQKRFSCSDVDNKECSRRRSLPEASIEMLGVWTEANLNCKLNGVINEGILDSILPYLVGYKKVTKTTSVYMPIIKKTTGDGARKMASCGGFMTEKDSRDRLGRRKSSLVVVQERMKQRQDGDVDIHVCDEVKGLKKDFRCPQKLLVSKMGYFADVTAGQRLEDMDISVHCDIQIFDWLMRWVKRDSILVADWPLLEPGNVIPILVSASFLQMEPLLHDCLIYCHAHMNDIVKTSTNLACLSDALLTRLAAMYTNSELESIRDRRDKIQSRLYCKMLLSLAGPAPETLRGHYATLASLYKCNKCNKLLSRHIAEQVPCQPTSMRIDRRGNVVSSHTRDTSWNLNEYISWLFSELRSWRRVYWRLWAESHFLYCLLCHSHFPLYQMEWCSYHEQAAQMFSVSGAGAGSGAGATPLPAGRYPCCGERAYRYDTLARSTGCQFREHCPDESRAGDAAALSVFARHRALVAMRPPHLVFPDRLTRLVPREQGDTASGRLECSEVFWWSGIQLVPPRAPFGLLGSLYSSNEKFNPCARPGSPSEPRVAPPAQHQLETAGDLKNNDTTTCATGTGGKAAGNVVVKQGATSSGCAAPVHGDEHSGSEEDSSDDADEPSDEASEEEAPPKTTRRVIARAGSGTGKKRGRPLCRQWVPSLSARSNQDGQRRFEERAARQMRAALVRRAAGTATRTPGPPGGIYARLETEWRERHATRRAPVSARPRALRGK